MSRRSWAIGVSVALLLVSFAAPEARAQVTRGPYLQNGSSSSVTFRWRTAQASNSRVRYGASPAALTAFVDEPTVSSEHEVVVSGLAANQTYYYSVGSSTTVQAGGDSNHFVVTAPAAGSSKPTRVWVLGDPGTGSSAQLAVRDAYYAFTGSKHTDLWLMLGDNAYNTGTDSEFQSKLFNVYGAMLRKSVLFSTRGNHESATSGGNVVYYNVFTMPRSGEAGGVASGSEAYYSFDYGNIHFICLDSFGTSRSASGAMATWLKNDLANNTKTWTIAFWHHPPYSKGSHNSDTESQLIEMRSNINPILEDAGVDLILGGHSHAYERSRFIDSHYGTSGSFSTGTHVVQSGAGQGAGAYSKDSLTPDPHSGAVYVVAGSSGQASGGALNHPAMYVSLNNLGSLVLDVDGSRLDVRFLRETSAVADSFTIVKSTPTGPPSAPVGLTATPGDRTVALAWAASSGATGYNLKRGLTSGGPYTLLASNLGTTSFTDVNLTNGTTYFYVVTAMNALGESGASNQASGKPVAASTTTFVALGAVWKFRDNGSNQGTAWRAPAFDDAGWGSGPAELGYGDDQATVLGYGPSSGNKYVTTYFRKSFTSSGPYSSLTMRLERDDGAVVYLNGVEVARKNLPSGTIGYTTLANSAAAEDVLETISIPPALLVEGTNVLAVEIHQSSGSSSDISFNLELKGNR